LSDDGCGCNPGTRIDSESQDQGFQGLILDPRVQDLIVDPVIKDWFWIQGPGFGSEYDVPLNAQYYTLIIIMILKFRYHLSHGHTTQLDNSPVGVEYHRDLLRTKSTRIAAFSVSQLCLFTTKICQSYCKYKKKDR